MSSSASRPASGSASGGASGGGGSAMLIRVDPAPSSSADAPAHSAHAAVSADEEPEASQALLSATGNEPARPLSATPSPSPAPPSGIGASASPANEVHSVVDAPLHGQFTRRRPQTSPGTFVSDWTDSDHAGRRTDRHTDRQTGGRRECTAPRMLEWQCTSAPARLTFL